MTDVIKKRHGFFPTNRWRPLALSAFACLVFALKGQTQQPNWTQIKPNKSPGARAWHDMAYDSHRKRTVLFGGWEPNGTYLSDTWEWDGKTWSQVRATTSPGPRVAPAMAYDSSRRRIVLFGGVAPYPNNVLADTWEFDGTNWTKMKPAASPSARTARLSYDARRKRMVLFGGGTILAPLKDTWEWDGKTWTEVKPARIPAARCGHGVAYDSARGSTVVFGGRGTVADTWEWNGKVWTERKPSTQPPGRFFPSMAFDSARHRTVMFGGMRYPTILADTWEWDGVNWLQIKTTTTPPVRQAHPMVYDSARQRIVLFGGQATRTGRVLLGDTWEYGGPKLALTTDRSTISIATGGTQKFTLDAGTSHANRLYWIFGSMSGTKPGVNLVGFHVPLNPDAYTDVAYFATNSTVFASFRGVLASDGTASASLNVPSGLPPGSYDFHHAYVLHDAAKSRVFMASNAVQLRLR